MAITKCCRSITSVISFLHLCIHRNCSVTKMKQCVSSSGVSALSTVLILFCVSVSGDSKALIQSLEVERELRRSIDVVTPLIRIFIPFNTSAHPFRTGEVVGKIQDKQKNKVRISRQYAYRSDRYDLYDDIDPYYVNRYASSYQSPYVLNEDDYDDYDYTTKLKSKHYRVAYYVPVGYGGDYALRRLQSRYPTPGIQLRAAYADQSDCGLCLTKNDRLTVVVLMILSGIMIYLYIADTTTSNGRIGRKLDDGEGTFFISTFL